MIETGASYIHSACASWPNVDHLFSTILDGSLKVPRYSDQGPWLFKYFLTCFDETGSRCEYILIQVISDYSSFVLFKTFPLGHCSKRASTALISRFPGISSASLVPSRKIDAVGRPFWIFNALAGAISALGTLYDNPNTVLGCFNTPVSLALKIVKESSVENLLMMISGISRAMS